MAKRLSAREVEKRLLAYGVTPVEVDSLTADRRRVLLAHFDACRAQKEH